MEAILQKNQFLKALTHVQNVVERRNTIPILANILIIAEGVGLKLIATDLDIELIEEVDAKIEKGGSLTAPAHLVYDIIRKLPDSGEIELISNDGKIMTLRAGKSKFSLGCLPKEDFPIIEVENLENELSIDSQKFLKLIDKTRFAISSEETRYFLNGIYFHKNKDTNDDVLTMVATDGHRLAKIDFNSSDNIVNMPGVIIPRKTIFELSKLLADYSGNIKINVDPNKIIFFVNKSILISKLIDGSFPDYQRVIPDSNNNILKVNRSSFCTAVDRVSTITDDKSPAIKFKLLKDIINMTSVDSESGQATEDVNVEYSGKEIEIGFNAKYILEMVSNLNDENVILQFNDSSSPLIVKEENSPNLIYVLMPMRV